LPTLVDVPLHAALAATGSITLGVVGLAVALYLGQSDGWAIALFGATAAVNLARWARAKRRGGLDLEADDLFLADASAHVEPAAWTCFWYFLFVAPLAAVTVGIVLLTPVVGAALAGWLAVDGFVQIYALRSMRRWESTHSVRLRGVRRKGIGTIFAPREFLAQRQR
jgi:hypothetical protein